jgi:hypothetical protein
MNQYKATQTKGRILCSGAPTSTISLKRMRHVFAESIIGTTGMLQESLILN